MKVFSLIKLVALSFSFISVVSAQPFPDKTIQYIIPFPPAGESDLVARYQADISAKKFKQPMVVMNRAGAGGAAAAPRTCAGGLQPLLQRHRRARSGGAGDAAVGG